MAHSTSPTFNSWNLETSGLQLEESRQDRVSAVKSQLLPRELMDSPEESQSKSPTRSSGDICEQQSPPCGTEEAWSNVHKERTQQEVQPDEGPKALAERCAELQVQRLRIHQENEELQEGLVELREELELQQHFEELQREIAVMQLQNHSLHEETKSVKAKLEQQAAVKQSCIELEDTRSHLCAQNKDLQLELTQLCEKLETHQSMEDYLERSKKTEKEIGELKMQNGDLQHALEQAQTETQQWSSLKERSSELQAETARLTEEKEAILQNMSLILDQSLEQIDGNYNLYKMEVSRRALEKENQLLLQHQQKMKEMYSAEKTATLRYQDKCQQIENLKKDNLCLQQDIVDLRCSILWCRSEKDSHRDLSKEEKQLMAKNKQLWNEKERLKKKCHKLHIKEKEKEIFQRGLSELQEENQSLRDKMQALNRDIVSQEMLKGRVESLKAEQKLAVQMNHDLKKQISWWKGVQEEQLPLLAKKQMLENEIEQLMKRNKSLRVELEDELIRVNDCELEEICTRALMLQLKETDLLNQKVTQEIAMVRSDKAILQQELERRKAQLQNQSSAEQHTLELQAERDRIQEENQHLQQDISKIIQCIANEKSWEQKFHVMQVSKNVLESENKQLKKHFQKLMKEEEALPSGESEYILHFQAVDDLRSENFHLRQRVHHLTTDIQSRKFTRECHKAIAKRDAHVSAKNVELRKRVEKLQKELQKLQPVEEEHQRVTQTLDMLRKEHCSLHNTIQALNKDITSKKMLERHKKSLETEAQWLLERQRELSEKSCLLERLHLELEPLKKQNEEWEKSNLDTMRQNERLRISFMKTFREVAYKDVLKMSNGSLKTQREEMERVNQELTRNMEQLQIHPD